MLDLNMMPTLNHQTWLKQKKFLSFLSGMMTGQTGHCSWPGVFLQWRGNWRSGRCLTRLWWLLQSNPFDPFWSKFAICVWSKWSKKRCLVISWSKDKTARSFTKISILAGNCLENFGLVFEFGSKCELFCH